MSTTTTERISPIKLTVGRDENGQVSATVPVRWSISPEMAQSLAEKAVEPFMLLAVTNNGQEMDRRLVRLRAGMTYLQMVRSGTNVIHATIVWEGDAEGSLEGIIMAKNDYGSYTLDLVRKYVPGMAAVNEQIEDLNRRIGQHWAISDDEVTVLVAERDELKRKRLELSAQPMVFGLYDGFMAFNRTPEGDQHAAEVPKEMFAPPPRPVVRWLATLYGGFWQRPGWRDQCETRKRALFTGLTLPLAFALAVFLGVVWIAVKLAACLWVAVLLFFGRRDIDYSVIYEPRNWELGDIARNTRASFWTHKKVKLDTWPHFKYELRDVAFKYINPPFMVLSFIIQLIINAIFDWKLSVLALVVSAVTASVILGLLMSLAARWMKAKQEQADDNQMITAEQRSRLERDLALLTAGGDAKLSDLPRQQRTVRLIYSDVKASVCKPYEK